MYVYIYVHNRRNCAYITLYTFIIQKFPLSLGSFLRLFCYTQHSKTQYISSTLPYEKTVAHIIPAYTHNGLHGSATVQRERARVCVCVKWNFDTLYFWSTAASHNYTTLEIATAAAAVDPVALKYYDGDCDDGDGFGASESIKCSLGSVTAVTSSSSSSVGRSAAAAEITKAIVNTTAAAELA